MQLATVDLASLRLTVPIVFFCVVYQTNSVCMFSKYIATHFCKVLLTRTSAKCNTCNCSNSHVGEWGVGGAAVTVGVEVVEGAIELVMGAL